MKNLFLRKIILLIMVFAFFPLTLSDCTKTDPPTEPVLSTSSVINIAATTATAGGFVTSDGGAEVTSYGVCWGTNVNPSILDSKTSDGAGTGQFVSSLTGLTAGTNYHIRAYAINSVGYSYGADITFTTLGLSPESVTQPATNVSTTGATLNGAINPNSILTTVTFEYGTTTSYGQSATAAQSPATGGSIVNVSKDITGLSPGTIYHYRVKTVNTLGAVNGGDMLFVTLGQIPASVTQPATNISNTIATLNGMVNANLLSTTVTFEYGLTTNYGQTISASQSPVTGNNNSNATADISGLVLGTTYHFRIKAVNSLGTTFGTDMSFTTTFGGSIPTNGLVAYYPFNSNANDESGNGNNGTVNGATLIADRHGVNGKAYQFDGSTSYIRVPYNASLLPGTGSYTFSGWFKLTNAPNNSNTYFFAIDDGNSDYSGVQAFYNQSSQQLWFLYHYDDSWSHQTYIKSNFDLNAWHHVLSTFDKPNLIGKLFIDGTLVATSTLDNNNVTAYTDFFIGRRSYVGVPGDAFFMGQIDDIRIYNRTVDLSEISALYHEGGWAK